MSELVIQQVPYSFPAAQAMTGDLQDYYRSLYRGPDGAPVDPAEFSPPSGRFYVGVVKGQPVAMGGWRKVEPMPALGFLSPAEIKRMYVVPASRGSGFARRMLAHLETTARADGADSIILSTGPPQVDAIALYRSAGYAEIEKFGYYARFPHAVHLGKRLAGARGSDEGAEPATASDGR